MAEIKEASRYGILNTDSAMSDFPAVMERVRAIRARISDHDSVKHFTELGVDVFLGQAEFTGPDTVVVEGKTLRFKKAVIATGARAVTPDIEGIKEAGFLTNETVFNLTEQPRRMAVIGGGPSGSIFPCCAMEERGQLFFITEGEVQLAELPLRAWQ